MADETPTTTDAFLAAIEKLKSWFYEHIEELQDDIARNIRTIVGAFVFAGIVFGIGCYLENYYEGIRGGLLTVFGLFAACVVGKNYNDKVENSKKLRKTNKKIEELDELKANPGESKIEGFLKKYVDILTERLG